MEVKVDQQKIKEMRLARSWSQEKLSEEAGVSLRTVQRMELDGSASLKSRLAVAQAFAVEPTELDCEESEVRESNVAKGEAPAESGGFFRNLIAYPGPKSVGPKIRTGILIFLWVTTMVTGGLLVVLTASLTFLSLTDPEIHLSQIVIASIPVAVVFSANAVLYLFFKRFLTSSA